MPLFRKPSPQAVRDFLAAQAGLDLTYAAVGATAAVPPEGYTVDRTRVQLGEGEDVFRAAKAALARWGHFRIGWVEASPTDTPLEAGACVAVVARVLGLWWVNACRIVYAVGDAGPVYRRLLAAAGFALVRVVPTATWVSVIEAAPLAD